MLCCHELILFEYSDLGLSAATAWPGAACIHRARAAACGVSRAGKAFAGGTGGRCVSRNKFLEAAASAGPALGVARGAGY